MTYLHQLRIAVTALLVLVSAPCRSAPLKDQFTLALWPGTAPGSGNVSLRETITERSTNPAKPDRIVTGITKPSITAFVPARANGTSLIVASGGGYVREVLDKEGVEVARRLAAKGVTVFLLKYRLPGEGHEHARDVPLQDAQRAVRLVRAHAAEWHLDPARIGFMGFSAGGHLAALLGGRFAAKVYEPFDDVDTQSARPDYLMLLYPVISMEDPLAHGSSKKALLGDSPGADAIAAYSADKQITAGAPQTLLVLADDDKSVLPEHSIRYYLALKRAGVPAELHVYAHGGHGFGIRGAAGLPTSSWPDVAWDWLGTIGMLKAAGHDPAPQK